ncbi:hypothetical protein FRC10_003158 [Ceratobasidium sp. 414]|nr:hypothetical protein FRC10_003158 [Ceratobasidium sp. 414]
MCQSLVPRLPIELLRLILESTEDLSALSLASHQFHQLSFPLIYHTLEFSRDTRVKEFIDLVSDEDVGAPLRISRVLRSLIVVGKYVGYRHTTPFNEDLVAEFRLIIPKLINLQHLTWHISTQPRNPDFFVDFQRCCTKLRSLDLDAGALRCNGSIRSNAISGPLLKMIQSSPALNTLILKLHVLPYFNRKEKLDVSRFFGTLGATLPRLRHLEIQATSKLEWNPVFDRAQSPNPVRSFFLSSSNIETLVIDWVPESSLDNPDLELVRAMFPALRHFTGPQRISAVLLASDVRMQLETLNILPFEEPDSDAYVTIVHAATELPHLRSLSFPAQFVGPGSTKRAGEYLYPGMLKRYLHAAPRLVSLKICSRGALDKLTPSILEHANIRQLTLSLPLGFDITAMHDLVVACPRLERLTNIKSHNFPEINQFERDNNGRLKRILDGKGREKYVILAG